MTDELRASLIHQRLFTTCEDQRLRVTPLLEPAYEGNTIDLRLGTKFVITRRTHYGSADPLTITESQVNGFLQTHWASLGEKIVLHPQMFMLAATLEYVALPKDLSGFINNRSSYGRLGVLTVTAPVVHAGYKGCLTLELLNGGDSAVVLTPGLRVAQLTLTQLSQDTDTSNSAHKYQYSTEPEFPKLWEDKDRDWLNLEANERK